LKKEANDNDDDNNDDNNNNDNNNDDNNADDSNNNNPLPLIFLTLSSSETKKIEFHRCIEFRTIAYAICLHGLFQAEKDLRF